MDQIEYTLLEPIEISVEGNFKKVREFILKAPKGKHIKYMDKLQTSQFVGVLELICCGDIMFTKEGNIPVQSSALFTESSIATVNNLIKVYFDNFNFFSL